MERILLLEDDISLVDGLVYTLTKNDYEVEKAGTVREALSKFNENKYDLLLLDVTLPDGTGFEVCETIRKTSMVPILFLTASDTEIDIVRGLDLGGDDYITKPFKLNELLARIKAALRRKEQKKETNLIWTVGDIQVDMLKNCVTKGGAVLDLTAGEYRLLCYLVQNQGTLLSRAQIEDVLWDQKGDFVDDNTLSVYIRRIRSKIEADPSRPELLQTVRGIGYRFGN